jgi:hypothetical protein
VAISVQHTDDGNRSDRSLHGDTSAGGVTWSTPAGGQINIDSNRFVQASNISDEGIYDTAMDGATTDQKAVIQVLAADTGPITRHNSGAGGDNDYMLGYFAALAVGVYIRSAGSFTFLGAAGAAAVNDDVGLESIGDDHQAELNGSPLGSPVTNATLPDGRCGMYFGGGTGQTQDNFEAWWDPGSGSNVTVEVPSASLTTATFAPAVTKTENVLVVVPKLDTALTGFAPTVVTTDPVLVVVPRLDITTTGFDPTVSTTSNVSIVVPVANLTTTGFEPTVGITGNQLIVVPKLDLTTTGFAPTISTTGHVVIEIPVKTLSSTLFEPSVLISADVIEIPPASLALTGFAPIVTSTTPLAAVHRGTIYGTIPAGSEWRVILVFPSADAPECRLTIDARKR